MDNNKQKTVVKLRKANRYNTYQFYAEMNNKNINPYDGLKIAALTCFSWLRKRLEGSKLPQDLIMPSESEYKKVLNDEFKTFTISDSYIVTVEADINEGIWALRVIENDSGTLDQQGIVPGRTIQSDIGFRVVENKLECGFKTTISDVNDVELAECIRFSLIKELGCNPNFGFKQINTLYNPNNMIVDDDYKLDEIHSILHSKENQLPLIIYTYDDHTFTDIKDIKLDDFKYRPGALSLDSQLVLNKVIQDNKKDNDDFTTRAVPYSNRYLGVARAYFLPKKMFNNFAKKFNIHQVNLDEVYVIDCGSNKVNRYSYNNKETYQNYVHNYTRNKELNFNDVLFVDEARIIVQVSNEYARQEREKLLDEAIEKLEQLKTKQARETRMSEYVSVDSSKGELIDTLEKLEKSEKEKVVLNNEINRLKKELQNKNDYIDYIHRKETRPKYHKDIEKWVEQFNNIILDKKAVACLNKNDAENVDVDVICDALDYLDKAYSKYLFENLSLDELNTISANIYNRPYNVTPSGIPVSAKGECKVKYAFVNENRIEHILDQHLKIGGHGELLRIYFVVDKDRKKIVIGSLPNHLEY